MARAQTASRGRLAEFDPLRWLWRVLTSVRFALGLIGFLALAALAGVLLPQVPIEMRGNPAAVARWLEFQEGRFGFLTGPMYDLGLFEVFRSVWFVGALALLVVSVCVCTANRIAPIWRNVTQPQTRVPDEYFEHGQPVLSAEVVDVQRLSEELRRRRYKVTLHHEPGATYLFADRFPWAQMATFVSHLALILFLAGGLVTLLTAKEQQVFVAEGEAGVPVFGFGDPDHMQIYVEDTVGRFDETGFPLEFRTSLVVYRNGEEIARGDTTVNSPLDAGGFRVHQSAYFPDGAALRVREVTSGRTVYDEVLALTSSASTPRVQVQSADGRVLLDDAIVPTDFISETAGTSVVVPETGRSFWIGARPGDVGEGWQLVAFETTAPQDGARAVLSEGSRTDLGGGLTLTFIGMTSVPSVRVDDGLPGAEGVTIAELSTGSQGEILTVGPIQGRALALAPGEPVVLGDYEYTFLGRREFAGLTVRRDPGSTLIWVATGLFLAGLALTFYTPRRRLWGKIASGKAAFRGLGGRPVAIEREIKEVAARAAGPATGGGR